MKCISQAETGTYSLRLSYTIKRAMLLCIVFQHVFPGQASSPRFCLRICVSQRFVDRRSVSGKAARGDTSYRQNSTKVYSFQRRGIRQADRSTVLPYPYHVEDVPL